MKLNNQKDFCAGLLFMAIGTIVVVAAGRYPFGTTMQMGPGYFPVLLGGILIVLGAAIGSRALWTGELEPLPRAPLRPLLLITLSILAFSFMLERFGLIPAITTTVLVSCLGGHEFKLREVIALAVSLAVVSVVLFHFALGLPFTLWNW